MQILANFEIEGNCIRQSLPDTTKGVLLSRFLLSMTDRCVDPESFGREGPTLFNFYCEWREDPNSAKSGPSSARQRNAI